VTTPTDAGAPAEAANATVPDDLIAEVYISSPNTTWTKLQRGVGGAMGILPMTMPGLVVTLSDLDPLLASELDGTSPMYGALAGDIGDPDWAIAMKLVDERRARGLLLDSDTSRYTAKTAAGMTLLVPKRAQSPGEEAHPAAITTNGFLVVARRRADGPLGNWVTRGLPARPPPTQTSSGIIDIPHKALSSAVVPRLKKMWGDTKGDLLTADRRMRAERGRAPDFGDPAAIVAALDGLVGRRIDVLGDVDTVRIQLDVVEDAVTLQAALVSPQKTAKEWLDAMKTGDPAPALALSANSIVALSTRDAEPVRVEQAASAKASLKSILGDRLKDAVPLEAVIDNVTKARDEVLTLSVTLDEPLGTFIRAPIRDANAARAAITSAIDLAKVDPFKEMLRVQSITSGKEDVGGLGSVSTTTFVRPKPDAGRKKDTGIAWFADDKELVVGAGAEPLVTLKTNVKPDKILADEPSLKRFTTAIANDASTVIIAQPLKVDPRRASLPAAPIAIGLGKRNGEGLVRVDIADPLIREVSRMQMGF
jgi:hypothetical protein